MAEFDDLESEEERVKYLMELLKPVAGKTGGRILRVQKDDEVQCSGRYENRPVRIIMDTSTGGLNVEIKLSNTVGIMDIIYDPEAEPQEDCTDPEWERREELRYFIGPGYFLEGYPENLAEEKRVLQTIDPAEVGKITALMERLGIGWVKANDAVLSCGLFESLFDPDEIFGIVLALHRYAAQFEKGGEQVAAAPAMTVGGVAVNPELVASMQTCPYCSSTVTVGADRRCPNCGGGI